MGERDTESTGSSSNFQILLIYWSIKKNDSPKEELVMLLITQS